MHIKIYSEEYKKLWDEFVIQSKNGTFLFLRDYMDYHKAIFIDSSLMVFNDNNILIALLPGNRKGSAFYSHQGLTYGGLITNQSMTQPLMLKVMKSVLEFMFAMGITHFTYKTIPHIYHQCPSDEDKYTLFLLNFNLIRRDVLTVIDTNYPIEFQSRRKRALRKVSEKQLTIKREHNFSCYWQLLEKNLQEKFGVLPVHSVAEISLLAERFPEHIKLFTCYDKEEILAGVVIYETATVAHFQYISANAKGKEVGALDWLFSNLIKEIYPAKRYIDFGISNEQEGRFMNVGLIDHKEGFGGRSIAHDFYQIELNSPLIDYLPGFSK